MNEMRAALYDRYGPPEVLYEGTVPTPVPRPGEVLVRVHAAGVNGGDLHARAGRVKVVTGRRFPQRTGIDFTGEIVGPGPASGARVWGLLPRGRFGSAAEYVTVRPRQLSLAPAGLSPAEAAALPGTGTTALRALRDEARLRPGERLLVRGAAGGVGSMAVQFGKVFGAHVTALAGGRNLDLVRELGADEAYDYARTSPAELGRFDVVLDAVGSEPEVWRGLLARDGGRMVAVAFDTGRPLRSVAYLLFTRRVRFFSGNPRHPQLAELAGFAERGEIRPVVDTVFPLERIADAHRALEAGGVRGKHIVEVVADAA
ncbi:NAD(P)-dependent alcohol dehydrogenase [Streptomyces sp. XM4011]|uniref:NAD(P)-dependent alcohol dehydrogenase n=1 Tax=Streptomyces TaxID=1883 RepID=UPI0015918140|nr:MULTISPECIES: NAD(P)-dependent alcohol dehydrogenase [Streptomyces]MCK1817062.1 NAD(P)-dependent alcohol dehydrogenase [Streptomyces sp. XM4011]QKV71574.1 NAD(P)-dependent alcohol dehydrogenase [Streptomyces harbinensis]